MQTIKTISDLFKEYPIKAAGIARKLGINENLMHHYTAGLAPISAKRVMEIQDAIREVGRELTEITLVANHKVKDTTTQMEDRVRELAKAGALIAAEIDRIQRRVAGLSQVVIVTSCAACNPTEAANTRAPQVPVDSMCESCGVQKKVERLENGGYVVHYFYDGEEIFLND